MGAVMPGDLFVKARQGETLHTFADRIASLFDLPSIERRESSNYMDEEYFTGTALSIAVTFARTDDADLVDYDFWIHLRPTGAWVEDRSFVDGLADVLARRLTIAGESVVRLPNAERKGGTKIFYTLNRGAPNASREQVGTREAEA